MSSRSRLGLKNGDAVVVTHGIYKGQVGNIVNKHPWLELYHVSLVGDRVVFFKLQQLKNISLLKFKELWSIMRG